MKFLLSYFVLLRCLYGVLSICVLDSKHGWWLDCGIRDSYLLRLKDIGGIQANFDFGIGIGDERGFPHSITKTNVRGSNAAYYAPEEHSYGHSSPSHGHPTPSHGYGHASNEVHYGSKRRKDKIADKPEKKKKSFFPFDINFPFFWKSKAKEETPSTPKPQSYIPPNPQPKKTSYQPPRNYVNPNRPHSYRKTGQKNRYNSREYNQVPNKQMLPSRSKYNSDYLHSRGGNTPGSLGNSRNTLNRRKGSGGMMEPGFQARNDPYHYYPSPDRQRFSHGSSRYDNPYLRDSPSSKQSFKAFSRDDLFNINKLSGNSPYNPVIGMLPPPKDPYRHRFEKLERYHDSEGSSHFRLFGEPFRTTTFQPPQTIGPKLAELLNVPSHTEADSDNVPSFAAKTFIVREAPREFHPPKYDYYPNPYKPKVTVKVPRTKFYCEEQDYLPGIYADDTLGCKVFHLCVPSAVGSTINSYLCPNGTLFDQSILQCNFWYNVDCDSSVKDYDSNLALARSYRKINAAHLSMNGALDSSALSLLSNPIDKRMSRRMSRRMGKSLKGFEPIDNQTLATQDILNTTVSDVKLVNNVSNVTENTLDDDSKSEGSLFIEVSREVENDLKSAIKVVQNEFKGKRKDLFSDTISSSLGDFDDFIKSKTKRDSQSSYSKSL